MKDYIRKTIIAALLITAGIGGVTAKIVQRPAYMFGFSASFKDSTVYMTNVQRVDSTWIDTRTKFLIDREMYSFQLKRFLTEQMGEPASRVCIVVFAWNQKAAEKKMLKMKKKYTTKLVKPYEMIYVDEKDFKFAPVAR